MSTFVNTKNIDDRIIYAVSGYLRRCQLLIPRNNVYYNIPSLVEYLCINYYRITEYFTSHGNYITLNDDKSIAQTIVNQRDTVYGNIEINNTKPMIYKWIFKILT